MQVNPGRRCRGAGAELRSPHRLPRGANCPETVERGFLFFFFLWEEEFCSFVFMGILVVCLLLMRLGEGGQEGASSEISM